MEMPKYQEQIQNGYFSNKTSILNSMSQIKRSKPALKYNFQDYLMVVLNFASYMI